MEEVYSLAEPQVQQHLDSLGKKYDDEGQSLACYLEGLFHSRELSYWEYIRLDSLLSLQSPLTHFPDETIFIVYHQIVELYFYLSLWELKQLIEAESFSEEEWLERISRVNRYLLQVTQSAKIMTEGMERKQFQKFRTRLTPASGFQSAQYRQIELHATGLAQLRAPRFRDGTTETLSVSGMYEQLYWKDGGRHKETGEKGLTLRSFEEKYDAFLLRTAKHLHKKNLNWQLKHKADLNYVSDKLVDALRTMDHLLNIDWRLAHFKMAVHHLKEAQKSKPSEGTGGTNWRQYLPSRFQRIVFFPDLWSENELENWGRNVTL